MSVTQKTHKENLLWLFRSARLLMHLSMAFCCIKAWKTWIETFVLPLWRSVALKANGAFRCSLQSVTPLVLPRRSGPKEEQLWVQQVQPEQHFWAPAGKAESRLLSYGLIACQHQHPKSKIKRWLVLFKRCWKWLKGWWWKNPTATAARHVLLIILTLLSKQVSTLITCKGQCVCSLMHFFQQRGTHVVIGKKIFLCLWSLILIIPG